MLADSQFLEFRICVSGLGRAATSNYQSVQEMKQPGQYTFIDFSLAHDPNSPFTNRYMGESERFKSGSASRTRLAKQDKGLAQGGQQAEETVWVQSTLRCNDARRSWTTEDMSVWLCLAHIVRRIRDARISWILDAPGLLRLVKTPGLFFPAAYEVSLCGGPSKKNMKKPLKHSDIMGHLCPTPEYG